MAETTPPADEQTAQCTCGRTACESDLCDCDTAPCPIDHATEDRRDRYAAAIRDKVRIRLGSSVAALAAQGRPLKMTLTEAEPAADAVMAVADAEHAELRAELDALRIKAERMRHELEVMYGGAFDSTTPDPR